MTETATNLDVVRRYLEAIEVFDGEGAEACLAPDVVQVERPNRLYPKGQQRGGAQMMRDLPRGAQVLRRQEYPIGSIFGGGDMVTVETRWQGILNVPLGKLKAGDAMVAHICMVFTLRDGLIVRQVNYDCYDEF